MQVFVVDVHCFVSHKHAHHPRVFLLLWTLATMRELWSVMAAVSGRRFFRRLA
jgi:hypothetical protein